MNEPLYAFVIWAGTEQKSVIKCLTITKGMPAAKQEVMVKWRGRQYATVVIQTGN